MTMKDFIKIHRKELDIIIQKKMARHPQDIKFNNEERRLWILNDESLYNWACSEGVKI